MDRDLTAELGSTLPNLLLGCRVEHQGERFFVDGETTFDLGKGDVTVLMAVGI